EWRTVPVFAMAANRGPLSERIMHLLGANSSREGERKIGVAGSIVFLTTALVAGNALFGIAHSRPKVYASTNEIRHVFQGMQSLPVQQSAATPAAKPSPAQPTQRSEAPVSAQSYIDGMSSAGMKDLSADDLIALKIQGVTPDYVRQMHDLGLHPD